MGTVFRRSYKDKQTGRTKRVRTYSIKFQNASGLWVTEPTDAVQKHIAQRLLCERELQVQRKLTAASTNGTANLSVPASSSSSPDQGSILLEYLRDCFLPSIRIRLKPSTAKMYRDVLRFVLPRLQVRSVGDLTLQHIETFMQTRLQDGTAPRTVNIQVSVVNRMLAWAQKQGIILLNPIAKWQPLREIPRRKRRSMQPQEAQALLAVAPLWRRVVYAVLLATGVRRGELIQLERTDLDLDSGVQVVRPELTKSEKGRRVFLPSGLVDLLREYLARDVAERPKRQDTFLARVRKQLAALDEEEKGDSPTAERLRYLEDVILRSRGHRFLFVNGKGLPIRRNSNLLRAFRQDLKKAKINSAGLDLHALRHTTNTTLLRGGVNPSIIRARLGHTTARMTETYTDRDALDQGGETGPIADLLGVADGATAEGGEGTGAPVGRDLTLETEEKLRPTSVVLAALVERYSNIVIGKLCRVSEAAVRKWLAENEISRTKRIVTKHMSEVEIALLRADLRAILTRETDRGQKAKKRSDEEAARPGEPEMEPPASRSA